jgi:VCBS repeat-containing protein
VVGVLVVAVVVVSGGSAGAADPREVDFAGDSILVIAPHPDDDILLAAGITANASHVTVAYVTNGDWCETITPAKGNAGYCQNNPIPTIGTIRQGEAVTAQARIGTAESDLIFLGYPDGDLNRLWFGSALLTARTETYASRGLGSTDWHDYRTGPGTQHAPYTKSALQADVYALIDSLRPDHIFTTGEFDRHQDHNTAWVAVSEAVEALAENTRFDETPFRTVLHSGIVHVKGTTCWGQWPDPASPTVSVDETCPSTSTWSQTCNCPLDWDARERFEVPISMQNSDLEANPKYRAIRYDYASQWQLDSGFLGRFVHKDEIFWPEVYAWGPSGIDDATGVLEGGQTVMGAPGVLVNDVAGVVGGGLTAVKVSDPVHGSVSLNADGSFTYTHDGSESTSDSFTYRPVQNGVQGTVATVNITITPVNDAPLITLLGDDPLFHAVGTPFTDPGAQVTDDVDAPSTITGVSTVNPDVVGEYTITYDYTDTSGEPATQVVRTVHVEPAAPASGDIVMTVDNGFEVFVNGVLVGSGSDWMTAQVIPVDLELGDVVAVHATDTGGIAGLLAELSWDGGSAVSDGSWRVSTDGSGDWETVGFDDSGWDLASTYGTYGVAPWNLNVAGFPSPSDAQWIWTDDTFGDDEAFFRYTVGASVPPSGDIVMTVDNGFEVFVNGVLVGSGSDWMTAEVIPVDLELGDVVACACDRYGWYCGVVG